ncbi:hypothetical protein Hanom_Chr02g00148861 [Helianthus anomalus]
MLAVMVMPCDVFIFIFVVLVLVLVFMIWSRLKLNRRMIRAWLFTSDLTSYISAQSRP